MRIGDYYTFVPAGFTGEKHGTVKQAQALPHKVTGTIVGINLAHRFCRTNADLSAGGTQQSRELCRRAKGLRPGTPGGSTGQASAGAGGL